MDKKQSKKLVLYVFHEINDRVDFFLKNGIFESNNVDFVLISQGISMKNYKPPYKNVKVIERQNIGRDFGAWSDVLLNKKVNTPYDYFIFINSSCKGPILPGFAKTNEWVDLMVNMLDKDIKLVGPTIASHNSNIYIQSYCFATDKIGLNILLKNKIFNNEIKLDNSPLSIYEMMLNNEVLMSHQIIESGYNLGCFLTCFSGIDFRKQIPNIPIFFDSTQLTLGHHFGFSYQPSEVIFFKVRSKNDNSNLNIYSKALLKDTSIFKLIPQTFNFPESFCKDYKQMNPDLKKLSDNQLKNHFVGYGRGDRENRVYESKVYKLTSVMKDGDSNIGLSDEVIFYKLIWKYIGDKYGIEIGGPSKRLFDEIIPVYKSIGELEIINFSRNTTWSNFQDDNKMTYFENKVAKTIVSDGSELANIKDSTYDVLLASHVLEHLANPLKAMKNWIRVIKQSGVILLVLPKKESTFDWRRPITKFSTIFDKYNRNVGEDDLSSLDEILELHDLSRDPGAPQNPQKFKERCLKNYENRNLHHHVFDFDLLKQIALFFNMRWLGQLLNDNHDQICLLQKK
jgi:SAM-dependent methyltransferase